MTLDYQLIFGIDKQMHVISYTVISLCCAIIIIFFSEQRQYVVRRVSFLWIALVTIGIVEEYRQFLIPNRSAELLDAIANMVGATIGLAAPLFIWVMIQYRNHWHFKLFILYSIVVIPLIIGLVYINERPFITMDEPVQEHVRKLVASLGL